MFYELELTCTSEELLAGNRRPTDILIKQAKLSMEIVSFQWLMEEMSWKICIPDSNMT